MDGLNYIMKSRKEIRDYILIMLGAPCIKVKLSTRELNLAINSAIDFMRTVNYKDTWNLQELALSYAQLILKLSK